MTLLKDGLTSIYLVSKQHMDIHWAKKSSGSLMDAHVSVILFSTSLKTQGDVDSLSCKRKILLVVEILAHDNILIGFIVI